LGRKEKKGEKTMVKHGQERERGKNDGGSLKKTDENGGDGGPKNSEKGGSNKKRRPKKVKFENGGD